MKSEVLNIDCMIGMKQYPDKYFDLAVVDPPYGIDINTSGRLVKEKGWQYKDWDAAIPTVEYFTELSRISKNQIIWGGNYFGLPATRCFLIWDKQQPEGVSFASCEQAWTSFNASAKTFYQRPQGEARIHPTQKPISLYSWIYKNYAPKKDCNHKHTAEYDYLCTDCNKTYKVLDTHLGSGSNRIAADKAGNIDFTGYELDRDYYEAQEKRFSNYKKQLKLEFT